MALDYLRKALDEALGLAGFPVLGTTEDERDANRIDLLFDVVKADPLGK